MVKKEIKVLENENLEIKRLLSTFEEIAKTVNFFFSFISSHLFPFYIELKNTFYFCSVFRAYSPIEHRKG